MPADVSQVRALARDLGSVSARSTPQVAAIMRKSGIEIRKRLQKDLAGSTHFKGAQFPFFVDESITDDGMEVKVYPGHGRDVPASLYNIAVFGSSRGGGTVPDPMKALEAESEIAETHLAKLLDGVL